MPLIENERLASARAAWDAGDLLLAGSEILAAIAPEDRPRWVTNVLSFLRSRYPATEFLDEIISIGKDQRRFAEAHGAFERLRDRTLRFEALGLAVEAMRPEEHALYIGENAAKVLYNASDPPDPFDKDSGAWLAKCFLGLASSLGGANQVSEEFWAVLCHRSSDE